MLRRSQIMTPVISFEEAHEEWMKNKKSSLEKISQSFESSTNFRIEE